MRMAADWEQGRTNPGQTHTSFEAFAIAAVRDNCFVCATLLGAMPENLVLAARTNSTWQSQNFKSYFGMDHLGGTGNSAKRLRFTISVVPTETEGTGVKWTWEFLRNVGSFFGMVDHPGSTGTNQAKLTTPVPPVNTEVNEIERTSEFILQSETKKVELTPRTTPSRLFVRPNSCNAQCGIRASPLSMSELAARPPSLRSTLRCARWPRASNITSHAVVMGSQRTPRDGTPRGSSTWASRGLQVGGGSQGCRSSLSKRPSLGSLPAPSM